MKLWELKQFSGKESWLRTGASVLGSLFGSAIIIGFLLPSFVLVSGSGCARRDSLGKKILTERDRRGIVGGIDVAPTDPVANSVVALLTYTKADPDHFTVCTASFISFDLLLTAAHCLPDNLRSLRSYSGRTGPAEYRLTIKQSVNIWDDSSEVPVIAWKSHPKFNSETFVNDVALVKLAAPLTHVTPLPIAMKVAVDKSRWKLRAIGYGRTSGKNDVDESDLQGLGRLRTVDLLAKSFRPSAKTFQVVMNAKRGFCNGDSGGPALIQTENLLSWEIVGVVSSYKSRTETVDCDSSGSYTNVMAFGKWILRESSRL